MRDKFQVWSDRLDKPDIPVKPTPKKFICPCGCGSFSRGGIYLRGHRQRQKRRLKK